MLMKFIHLSVNAAEVQSVSEFRNSATSHEEAIGITTLVMLTGATNQVDTFSSIQYPFKQETMDKSDEIFV